MQQEKKYLRRSLVLTAILYAIVFVVFFVSLQFHQSSNDMPGVSHKSVKIVQAVAVSQNKVQEEMNKIKAEEHAKKEKEIAHQRYLKRMEEHAREQRMHEQQQVQQLKKQQLQLQKQRQLEEIAAQKKLTQMKKQEQQEAQHLKSLQAQKKAQAAKAAAAKSSKEKQLRSQEEQALAKQIAAEQSEFNAAHNREIQSEVDKYKALILNSIGQQWIMPPHTNKKLSTQLLIKLAPGGTVLSVSVLNSSGDSALDHSVITAVWKASPLPVPTKAEVFNQFRELHLTVRPEGLLN